MDSILTAGSAPKGDCGSLAVRTGGDAQRSQGLTCSWIPDPEAQGMEPSLQCLSVPTSVPQLLRACLLAPSFSFELTGESLQRLVLPPRTAGKSRNWCLGWGWREAPAAYKSIYHGVLPLCKALGPWVKHFALLGSRK